MVSRRKFLMSGATLTGAGIISLSAPNIITAFSKPRLNYVLKAQQTEWDFNGKYKNPPKVFSYQKQQPIPVIRMKQGEPFKALLQNALKEPTTIHWHGIRLPNAMDGVPYLTQEPVYTGDEFLYEFTPKDAGTYFYHSHFNSLAQLSQGLSGMVIVEENQKPDFDDDIPLNLRDWRLDETGDYLNFLEPKKAARAGTFGTLKTTNWQVEPSYFVKPQSLIRVRILVADVTRIFKLMVNGAKAKIIAIDGNPVDNITDMGREWVGPGMRLDIAILTPKEGDKVEIVDTSTNRPWPVATFVCRGTSNKRQWNALKPLPQNPIEPININGAEVKKFTFSAGFGKQQELGVNCAASQYIFWAINKTPIGHLDPLSPALKPTADLELGKTYIFEFINVTPHTHPIHLHGFFFRVLQSNKRKITPHWADTALVKPDETIRVAFKADTKGLWLLHCHILEHQKTGMTGFIRIS